jgi:hypothetical protein
MGKAVEILSNLKVRNLGPGLHRDGGGLVLVVDAGGSRNWGFVYREPYTKDKFGNGKRTKLGLGGYPPYAPVSILKRSDDKLCGRSIIGCC